MQEKALLKIQERQIQQEMSRQKERDLCDVHVELISQATFLLF